MLFQFSNKTNKFANSNNEFIIKPRSLSIILCKRCEFRRIYYALKERVCEIQDLRMFALCSHKTFSMALLKRTFEFREKIRPNLINFDKFKQFKGKNHSQNFLSSKVKTVKKFMVFIN